MRTEFRGAESILVLHFLLVFLLCLAPMCMVSAEELLEIRSEGMAVGTGLRARHLALQEAEVEAVKSSILARAPKLEPVYLNRFLNDYRTYVDRSSLIRQERKGDEIFVEAQVWVKDWALRHELAITILPLLSYAPRIQVAIREYGPEEKRVRPTRTAESFFTEKLGRYRFEISNSDSLVSIFGEAELGEMLRSSEETYSTLALASPADIVVFGVVRTGTSPMERSSSMHTCEAAVTLYLYSCESGKRLNVLESRARLHSADIDAGIQQAVLDGSYKLLEPVKVACVLDLPGEQADYASIMRIDTPLNQEDLNALLGLIRANVAPENALKVLFFHPQLAKVGFRQAIDVEHLHQRLSGQRIGDREIVVERAIGREMVLRFEALEEE